MHSKKISAGAAAAIIALFALGANHHNVIGQSATGSVHPTGWGQTPQGFVLTPQRPRAVPTGTMWDAVTLANVPSRPFAVAGYTSGFWPTWFSMARDFPGAHRVSIAISILHHAMCGDFEPGDMTSAQAGPWALADIRAGFPIPCLYGDLSNMPAIQASLRAWLGSGWRARVLLWLAWYRGIPGLVSGYDAVQWTDRALGRNLDASTVTLNFLRIAQPPYVPPNPLPVCYHKRESSAQCAAARAQVASSQRAIASSQRAYQVRGCPVLAQRISWFSGRLRSQPHTRVAYRRGALAASQRVYGRQGCPVFVGRVRGNAAAVRRIESAN